MNNDNDDNTEITGTEEAFISVMALIAATRAGELARVAGHPPPTEEESAQMGRLWCRALTAFVRPLQLAELVEGIAQGAVARVLGAPSVTIDNSN